MIWIRTIWIAILGCVLFNGYAKADSQLASPQTILAPDASAETTFRPYISKDKTFKILLPGIPTIRNISVPETNVISSTTYSVYSNGLTYTVNVTKISNLSSKSPQVLLDDIQNKLFHNPQSPKKLLNQNNITLNGKYPGREFEMINDNYKDVVVRQRIFLINDFAYQLEVAGSSSKMVHSGPAELFLHSLNIIQ